MEPYRMCMVCRERRKKSELLRIARVKGESPALDPGQSSPGRGMYLCKSSECLSQAKRRRVIERAFGCADIGGVYELLETELER